MATNFRLLSLLFLFIAFSGTVKAQNGIVAGPMIGYVEHQSALIWVEVEPKVKSVCIEYWPLGSNADKSQQCFTGTLNQEFNPVKIELNGLKINTAYQFQVIIDSKLADKRTHQFKTKKVWARWSKNDPADFSVMIGSCTYLNDSIYDRPGKPYGQNPAIFNTMTKQPADFMIWTGDNLYLREADWSSPWGIKRRFSRDRSRKELQELLAVRPNYAIWDDHDFGPNDSNHSYELKDVTMNTFKDYWGNKTFGEDGKGIYSKFNFEDAEFFLLDNRYFRSANELKDSINGKPNPEKLMFGPKQMKWLKDALISSQSNFKVIIMGGQALNPIADKECFRSYPAEFNELIEFISGNKIEGIFFISGDRHFSELISIKPTGTYALYDFTCSPLTSGTYKNVSKTKEGNNPNRVEGTLLTDNNFGLVEFYGKKDERAVKFSTYDIDGKKRWEYSLKLKDLDFE
jgi:alkaline phosphatase D